MAGRVQKAQPDLNVDELFQIIGMNECLKAVNLMALRGVPLEGADFKQNLINAVEEVEILRQMQLADNDEESE